MNATSNLPAKLVAADVSPLHLNPRKVGADSRQLLQIKESTRPSPLLASLFLCVFALMPLGVHAATNELSTALQTGLFEEEANRNLPAAVEAYEKVAKQFDQNRALAATAIFRLGEVNRKLGKTNEAATFYQRILRDFSEQETLAKLSQQNLTGMGLPSPSGPTAPDSKAPDNSLIAEARRLEVFLQTEKLLSSPADQYMAIVSEFPGDPLKDLLARQEAARANLSKLQQSFGSGHPEVKAAEKELVELFEQAEQHRASVMKMLQARYSVLTNLIARSGSTVSTAPITAVLDEEETEIRRIQAMIQNSPDLINAPSGENGTPLYQAASKG